MTVLKTSLIGFFIQIKTNTFCVQILHQVFERLYLFDIKEIYDIDEDGDPFHLKNTFALVAA